MGKINGEIIMENENFKLIKVNEEKYEIYDCNNNYVFGIEGKCTKEELEEHFNSLYKGFQII